MCVSGISKGWRTLDGSRFSYRRQGMLGEGLERAGGVWCLVERSGVLGARDALLIPG